MPDTRRSSTAQAQAGLRSARLVAWGNAWLAGATSLDEAAAEVTGRDDGIHRVHGLGAGDGAGDGVGAGEHGVEAVTVSLGRLRARGVRRLRLVLPVPADPSGLPGPPPFNTAALSAGEAVLTVGGEPLGLLPEVHGPDRPGCAVAWRAWRVNPTRALAAADVAAPDLAAADAALSGAVRDVTAALLAMDVARWHPEVAEAVAGIRNGRCGPGLAPGYPPRAHRVLAQAERLAHVAALALSGPGAAVSAREIEARREALRPLERAIRRARVAAYNSPCEPPCEPETDGLTGGGRVTGG